MKTGLGCLAAVLIGIAIGRQFGGTGTQEMQELDLTAAGATDSGRANESLIADFDQSLGASGAEQISDIFTVVQRAQTADDCRRLAEQLLANESNATSKSLWAVLFARWSQIAPRSMVAFVDGLDASKMKAAIEDTAFFAWGAVDPEACIKAVRLRKPSVRTSALHGVADVDGEKAAELALTMPNAQGALYSVASRVSLPEDALKKYLERSIYDGSRRALQNTAIQELAESDPAAAVAQAEKNGRNFSDPVAAALSEITRHDPKAAIEQYENLPDSRSRAISAVSIAKTWAATDPEAALEWARSDLTTTSRRMALLEIAAVTGGRDPASSLALFDEIGWENVGDFYDIAWFRNGKYVSQERQAHSQPEKTAAKLLTQLAADDPKAAILFIASTPDPVARRLLEMTKLGEDPE